MKALRVARLDTQLRGITFGVLRRLCGRIGHLPDSYLLSDKFNLSGMPQVSGGFSNVRMGVFKGKDVAVKTLRVSKMDDRARVRKVGKQITSSRSGSLIRGTQNFCKEVVAWKNLSHPNVLNLIGVPDTLEDGRFSMVSEWMVNGNITEYVRSHAGNHPKLVGYNRIFPRYLLSTFQLADAIEGLKYLHNANIVHGGLKGVSPSIRIPRMCLM